MAITKSSKSAAPPAEDVPAKAKKTTAAAPKAKAKTAAAPAATQQASKGTPSWYKRGDDVRKEVEKEEKRRAERKQEQGKMWRFYLKDGEEARTTFVDGNLTKNGVLDGFTFREHEEKIGNDRVHYVCTSDHEPCPICALGKDHQPSLVTCFTVIDHREFKGRKGTYKDRPRLFVAKSETFKLLQGIAAKRGGLAGATFDIMRQGEYSANVGNHFDFIEKGDINALRKKYVQKNEKTKKVETVFAPADYTSEITYRDAAELRKLGYGKTPIGGEGALPDSEPTGSDAGSEM